MSEPIPDPPLDFVDWDPHFFPWEPHEPDADGLVWLYDAEGTPLLKCEPRLCGVIAAALEYAYADVEAIYGCEWGNLSNTQVATLLMRYAGQHRHVGADLVLSTKSAGR